MLRPVPLPGRLWIVETGVSHRLTGGALNERRRECEEALAFCREWRPGLAHLAQLSPGDLPEIGRRLPPPLVPRVRHVVTETARTRSAADALAAGDLATLGRLLVEGHESLRADYESTIPEADFIVASAVEHGAYGARLTGAGWGGAVVVLAPAEREARVVAEIGTRLSRSGMSGCRSPGARAHRAGCGVRRFPIKAVYLLTPARVAKSVDARDLKSLGSNPVRVRVPPRALALRCVLLLILTPAAGAVAQAA